MKVRTLLLFTMIYPVLIRTTLIKLVTQNIIFTPLVQAMRSIVVDSSCHMESRHTSIPAAATRTFE
jgi:hypothetical protein